jgi:hypothetical protein
VRRIRAAYAVVSPYELLLWGSISEAPGDFEAVWRALDRWLPTQRTAWERALPRSQ